MKRYDADGYGWWQLRLWPLRRWLKFTFWLSRHPHLEPLAGDIFVDMYSQPIWSKDALIVLPIEAVDKSSETP